MGDFPLQRCCDTMLRNVMLLVRPTRFESAVKFYNLGLGLPIRGLSDSWAELDAGGDMSIVVQSVEGEAACSTGYSPLINFEVADLAATIPELLMQGAELDGPIKYPRQGKVAVLRSPDGHMIGISESVVGTDG